MRSLVLIVVLSSVAHAQPAPVETTDDVVQEPSSLQLRAGLGFGRYREYGPGWKWESDLQPFAQLGAELALPAGRGHFIAQAAAGLGSDAHMEGSGQLMQENDFHQQIYEASPRYRHPLNARMYFEGGYRFTLQRLFFTNIPMIDNALETVTVHALEAGIGWRRANLDGSRKHAALTVGLNRGFAENDRIEGEDFSAGGISLDFRAGKRWASGFQLEAQFAYRKQSGSDPAEVTFDGMLVQAFWPDNVTWQLLAVIGFAL